MNVHFALVDNGKLIACTQHECFSFVSDLEEKNISGYNSYLGDLLATYVTVSGINVLVALQLGG